MPLEEIEVAHKNMLPAIYSLIMSIPQTEHIEYNEDPRVVEENLIASMSEHPVFIVRDGTDIIGCLVLSSIGHFWNAQKVVTNSILYIKPEHRSIKLFKRFLEVAEKYAKIKDIEFIFSLVHVVGLDVKERLAERLGYTKIGSMLEKN